jgi:hypothetical protein
MKVFAEPDPPCIAPMEGELVLSRNQLESKSSEKRGSGAGEHSDSE